MSEIVKIFKECIKKKQEESRGTKNSKVAESMKNNADNGGKICEVKMKKKKQTPHRILNCQGQ